MKAIEKTLEDWAEDYANSVVAFDPLKANAYVTLRIYTAKVGEIRWKKQNPMRSGYAKNSKKSK